MTYRNRVESQKAINLSGNCCIICGWKKSDFKGNTLLIGSHVRPFHNTADYDKCDNIISLCPNHHAEFDKGNITIDPESEVSVHIDSKDPFHNKKIVGKISHIQKGYFSYHLKNIFRSETSEKLLKRSHN